MSQDRAWFKDEHLIKSEAPVESRSAITSRFGA